MRLICPNCGAQYEVDDRVIPDNGRDVQCSSCGHAWYQMPSSVGAPEEPGPVDADEAIGADDDSAELEPDIEPEPGTGAGDGPDSATEAPDLSAAQATATVEPAAGPEPSSEVDDAAPPADAGTPLDAEAEDTDDENTAEDTAENTGEDTGEDTDEEKDKDEDTDDDKAAPAGTEGKDRPRRELDQNLRAILQEEVAREMAARATDTDPDATQSRSDPEPAPASQEESAASSAPAEEPSKGFDVAGLPEIGLAPTKPRGAEVFAETPVGAEADKASRKDLFPDIEEINSTLDSHGPTEDVEEEFTHERRGGFGRGFFAIIFIAALALALYLVAPQLGKSIPALEPALTGYVDAVNTARAGLDAMLRGVTEQIDSAE